MHRLCGWLACLLSLLAAGAAAAQPLPSVKLGLVVPMAGEAGRVGLSMRRAAELAVEDWAPRLDRKVELIVKDDGFEPRQAVSVAEKLVQDGVWGVVGHFYSSSSIPASAVYFQAGIPQVTPTSTHPRLTSQGFDTVFRVTGRDDQQALTAAEFIVGRLRARRVAVVHDRTEYGRTLAEALIRAVERAGRRVVCAEEIAQGDKEFGPLASRLKALEPDAIYFGGIFREGGYLIRQIRQAGLVAAFVSGDGVLDPEFVKIASEDAVTGVYLTFAPDPRLLPTARPLIRRFEDRYGTLGPYVLYTYDAVGVLLRAIQVAKPEDGTREELRRVVRVLHTRPYEGAWDKNGDLIASPYVVYVAKKGGSLQGWFEQVTGIPEVRGAKARPSGLRRSRPSAAGPEGRTP